MDPINVRRDLPVGRLDPAKMCVWAAPRLSGGAVAKVEGSCAALTGLSSVRSAPGAAGEAATGACRGATGTCER